MAKNDRQHILVAHVAHHKCNGSGQGTRFGRRCRGCEGTGEAAIAFIRKSRLDGLLATATQLDELITSYVECCYGEGAEHYFDEDRRPCYVLTVLPHAIDRDQFETVVRLGQADKVFNWLRAQECEHCPEGAENEWTP